MKTTGHEELGAAVDGNLRDAEVPPGDLHGWPRFPAPLLKDLAGLGHAREPTAHHRSVVPVRDPFGESRLEGELWKLGADGLVRGQVENFD